MPTPTQTTRTERPDSLTEAVELLRETTGTLLFRGGGTKTDWAGRVHDPDLIVDTTDMQGMLTHNPADMTASVRAGTTLAALQDKLAGDGQWLALDPPSGPTGATVGGLLAAGDSGPSRLRYGGLRDLVIGVTLVLSDGTVARAGSHVIKNVAGYDLSKLVHGSLGSLALIAEVIVRLHPRPAASTTTTGPADAQQATSAVAALAASPLEPAAVEWIADDGLDSGWLYVRTDGTPVAVEAAGARLADLLRGVGISAETLTEPKAESAWADHATAVLGADGETVLRIAGLPSDLTALAHDSAGAAESAGVQVRLVSSAALGVHTVRLHEGSPAGHAQALGAIRERAQSRGASVLVRRRPDEVDDHIDVLGAPPSGVALLRAVKAQFDPAGRCAPGRFQPWY